MNTINLGDKVKDSITGFTGVVVGITQWLHGCRRCIVQPDKLDKDNKPFDSVTFDEPQLELIKAKKVPQGDPSKGGPRPEAVHKEEASRR